MTLDFNPPNLDEAQDSNADDLIVLTSMEELEAVEDKTRFQDLPQEKLAQAMNEIVGFLDRCAGNVVMAKTFGLISADVSYAVTKIGASVSYFTMKAAGYDITPIIDGLENEARGQADREAEEADGE